MTGKRNSNRGRRNGKSEEKTREWKEAEMGDPPGREINLKEKVRKERRNNTKKDREGGGGCGGVV